MRVVLQAATHPSLSGGQATTDGASLRRGRCGRSESRYPRVAGTAECSVGGAADHLGGPESFLLVNDVAARPQGEGEIDPGRRFQPNAVGLPLVMKPRLSQGRRRRQAVVERVEKSEQNLRDDGRAPGCSDAHDRFTFGVKHDRRTHAGQRPFARSDAVGLSAHQAEMVGHSGCASEVVHFVVEEHPGSRHHDLRPESSVNCGGDARPVALRVGRGEVGSVLVEVIGLPVRRLTVLRDRSGLYRIDPRREFTGIIG